MASMELGRACGLGQRYPAVVRLWRDQWETFIPFPAEIRRVVYTNMIESINYQLRKVTKNRGQFSSRCCLAQRLYGELLGEERFEWLVVVPSRFSFDNLRRSFIALGPLFRLPGDKPIAEGHPAKGWIENADSFALEQLASSIRKAD